MPGVGKVGFQPPQGFAWLKSMGKAKQGIKKSKTILVAGTSTYIRIKKNAAFLDVPYWNQLTAYHFENVLDCHGSNALVYRSTQLIRKPRGTLDKSTMLGVNLAESFSSKESVICFLLKMCTTELDSFANFRSTTDGSSKWLGDVLYYMYVQAFVEGVPGPMGVSVGTLNDEPYATKR